MSDENQNLPTLLKSIPEEDRPRERLLRFGGEMLSDTELVAILLRVGRRGQSAIEMAAEVLREAGGVSGLLAAKARSLERRGLGRAKAATLLAAIELGRRLARTRIPDRDALNQPELVANYLALRYVGRDQEVMGALYLDVRNHLLADLDIYRGTLCRAAVEPRVILKEGLQRSASGIILFHTHPSGDPTPSNEDLAFTKRLATAAEQLGMRLLDHLIIGGTGRWVSLHRRGAW